MRVAVITPHHLCCGRRLHLRPRHYLHCSCNQVVVVMGARRLPLPLPRVVVFLPRSCSVIVLTVVSDIVVNGHGRCRASLIVVVVGFTIGRFGLLLLQL
jgi:hypothetical protein